MRRQQVGTSKNKTVCSVSGSFLGFAFCCGVKVAEYLQRIVRLVTLLFVSRASPHRPTVDSVVGGLAQGLARGVKAKVTVTFYRSRTIRHQHGAKESLYIRNIPQEALNINFSVQHQLAFARSLNTQMHQQ